MLAVLRALLKCPFGIEIFTKLTTTELYLEQIMKMLHPKISFQEL